LGPPARGFSGKDVDNENSLVAKLVYGDFSVLLTGDAGDAAEQALIAQGAPLPSTVLKVAHHGSKFSSSERFVAAVNPPLALIQVGAGNDYGHPSTETLVRLQGQLVLRNDQHGRIHFWSDGQKLWITPHILRDSANSRGKVESLHTIRSWFLAGICALVPPVEKEVVL
jgi:competence protein ComEC